MRKILVVDDEALARSAIEDSIKAADESIKVFTAANGDEALAVIENEDLDVIMTDIKMPGISGMELLEEIRKLGLDIQVIILSSYNEFGLVRQAIQLGAFDYLFKPAMMPEDILKVVQKAFDRQNENMAKMKQGNAAGWHGRMKERDLFFSELISGSITDDERYHEFVQKYCLTGDIDKIVVVVFKLKLYQESLVNMFQNDVHLLKSSVGSIMNETAEQLPKHQVVCNNFYEYILISWDQKIVSEKEFLEKNNCVVQQIISSLNNKYRLDFLVGTSSIGKTFIELSKLYLEATYDSLEKNPDFENYGSMDKFKGSIPLSQEMKTALEYIKIKLGDKDLSLQMIADHVGLSRNYFSKFFKDTMGVNFIDYITRLRAEKAKSLYINTDMKIYEIAELVGYSDWHYLYNVYKKLFGHSMTHEIKRKSHPE